MFVVLVLSTAVFYERKDATFFLQQELNRARVMQNMLPHLAAPSIAHHMAGAVAIVEAGAMFEIDYTREGYFTIVDLETGELVKREDGSISRHVVKDEAEQMALSHASKLGPGKHQYRILHPTTRVTVDIFVAEVQPGEPVTPEPPPPPVETLEQLDENTVYFCPSNGSGAGGGTAEPAGSDANDGFDPFKPKDRVNRMRRYANGTDIRLCESGIWHDQQMVIRHSGDLGPTNTLIVGIWRRNQIAAYIEQGKDPSDGVLSLHASQVPGFNPDEVDPLIVGGYKILNGVPRPLMNAVSRCNLDATCINE